MNVLVILQGPAYGDERAYNGLRLADNLAKRDDVTVKIFCFGNAVGCAVAGQKLPNGYYHLDRMLTAAAHHGAEIGLCGTCMDARGITDTMLVAADTRRSSLDEVTDWTLWAGQNNHLLTVVDPAEESSHWDAPNWDAFHALTVHLPPTSSTATPTLGNLEP